jgi:hypothetical protein
MLDQLINIVKQMGQNTVVKNPDVPNEHNQEVMADATNTIASGFKNVMAGGGLQSIIDLFRGGGSSSGNNRGGIGGLLKNPIVMMMVGHFISKLVTKYKMKPAAASNVANNLIPGSLEGLIEKTKDPANPALDMDGLLNSIAGGGDTQEETETKNAGSPLQGLLEKFAGGDNNGDGKVDLQDLVSRFTRKSQNSMQDTGGGGGLMDMIKGFLR